MNKHRIGALIAAGALTLSFAGTAFAVTVDWNGKDNLPCTTGGYWVVNNIELGQAPVLKVDGVQASLVKFVGNDKTAHYTSGPVTANTVVDLTPNDGQVQLSHCEGTTTTTTTDETTDTTSTVDTETSSTTTDETTSTTTIETSSTSSTTTIETSSTTSTIDTVTTSTDSVDSSTESTESVDSSTESTDSVESETESKTPPSTDTVGTGGPGTPGGALWALLVGAAGILAGVLLLTPKSVRTRR